MAKTKTAKNENFIPIWKHADLQREKSYISGRAAKIFRWFKIVPSRMIKNNKNRE